MTATVMFSLRPLPTPSMTTPLATHDYTPGGLDAALEFLKRTRAELRALRRVRVWKDRLHIIDVNKDFFEVRGIGYADADIVPLLHNHQHGLQPGDAFTSAIERGVQGVRHRQASSLGA